MWSFLKRHRVEAGLAGVVIAAAIGYQAGLVSFAARAAGAAQLAQCALPQGSQLAAPSAGFGLQLLDRLDDHKGNLFISPLSAMVALALTSDGATGQTREEMAQALGLSGQSPQAIRAGAARLLIGILFRNSGVELEMADAIWTRQGAPIQKALMDHARDCYGASTNNANFQDPRTAAEINAWVAQATHGRITKMVDRLDRSLVALIFNALYMHGDWKEKFDAHPNPPTHFAGPAAMMGHSATYGYYTDGAVQVVAIPYQGDQMAMVLVLPTGKGGVDALGPVSLATWARWMDGLRPSYGEVEMPKLSLGDDRDLIPALGSLGMTRAFTAQAELGGICERCFISMVRQKTRLEVDESGTTAAAVTEVGTTTASVGFSGFTFVADRPFLMGIVDLPSGVPVFLGKIRQPQAASN